MRLPGDKSLAHRALLLAGLARSSSIIRNLPLGDDVAHTIQCLRALGVIVDDAGDASVCVSPVPWRTPATPLDCGNSGTLARLLMGALAGEGIEAELVGDASLSRRPMARVAVPLRELFVGDVVDLTDGGTLPARMHRRPARDRTVISIETRVASAQVKSALILAARNHTGGIAISEPTPTRDHTERMLRGLGVELTCYDRDVLFDGPIVWDGIDTTLPGDASSAALLAAYAVITGKTIDVDDLLWNPLRIGFFTKLTAMGARVDASFIEHRYGEPVARVIIRGRAPSPVDVSSRELVDLIDEVPALAVVAACATGITRIHGVSELRVKESDRVALLVELLSTFGARASAVSDTLVIEGPLRRRGGRVPVRTDGDHRIAMAALVLARAHGVDVDLDVPGCERTSFPEFTAFLDRLDVDARAL